MLHSQEMCFSASVDEKSLKCLNMQKKLGSGHLSQVYQSHHGPLYFQGYWTIESPVYAPVSWPSWMIFIFSGLLVCLVSCLSPCKLV